MYCLPFWKLGNQLGCFSLVMFLLGNFPSTGAHRAAGHEFPAFLTAISRECSLSPTAKPHCSGLYACCDDFLNKSTMRFFSRPSVTAVRILCHTGSPLPEDSVMGPSETGELELIKSHSFMSRDAGHSERWASQTERSLAWTAVKQWTRHLVHCLHRHRQEISVCR